MANIIRTAGGCTPILKQIGSVSHSGKWNTSVTKTFNVASVYSNYKKLTVDDFAIPSINFWSFRVDLSTNAVTGVTKSYDASTGTLTLVFSRTDTSGYRTGYDFSYPIIILDKFGGGVIASKLLTLFKAYSYKMGVC